MIFPFCAFRTDSVIAAEILCVFGTADLTQFAIGADFHAVFAFPAFLTVSGAVGAVFAAINADVIRTVAAIIAVAAHYFGTVHTDAAVGTEFVHTSGALPAIFTDVFGTVSTDDSAVLTNFRAVSALITLLAELLVCTFPTDIAGCAEFIRAA